jgi:hypothetical protein
MMLGMTYRVPPPLPKPPRRWVRSERTRRRVNAALGVLVTLAAASAATALVAASRPIP